MSQIYDSTKPEDGVTTFADLYGIILNHFETLRSGFSGTAFPTSPTPVAGQLCFRTDLGLLYAYNGAGWKEVGLEDISFLAEIENSRGTKPTMDQRLDVFLNEDGTPKAGTSLNPSQWLEPSLTFTYVNTTTFTVDGDQRDIYKPTRRLKVNLTASVAYSEVVSATWNSGPNTTSVLILNAVLDNTLVSVEHSIILPRVDNGALSFAMLDSASEWMDYSAISTVTGWSSLDIKKIFYKKIGRIAFVSFRLSGPSNSSSVEFTLPYALRNVSGYLLRSPVQNADNGVLLTSPGVAAMTPSLNSVVVYKDYATGAWTNSGTKTVTGNFWYETEG
jgi:hypothetical protein